MRILMMFLRRSPLLFFTLCVLTPLLVRAESPSPNPFAGDAAASAVRETVSEYLAALSSHDVDRIVACVTDDFVNEHTSALGSTSNGRDTYRGRLPGFLGQFEGLRYDVVDTIVEGERAAVRYRMTANSWAPIA